MYAICVCYVMCVCKLRMYVMCIINVVLRYDCTYVFYVYACMIVLLGIYVMLCNFVCIYVCVVCMYVYMYVMYVCMHACTYVMVRM